MRRDKKIWIGILAGIGLLAPLTNAANALTNENNLSKPVVSEPSTAKAVFLVSKPKSLVKVKKNINVLAKYQNSTTLTDAQLKDLLRAVGFKGKGLVKAWAVAKKESNGRPLAFNGNAKTGDSSFGIFQINMLQMLGPDRRAKFGINFNSELLNPVINAQVAYHMSNAGEDWSAWHGVTAKTKYWMKKFPY